MTLNQVPVRLVFRCPDRGLAIVQVDENDGTIIAMIDDFHNWLANETSLKYVSLLCLMPFDVGLRQALKDLR